MNANTRLHMKVFLSNFEMGLEAGILITVADLFWLFHDVATNGMSIWYGLIMLALIIGIVWMCYILYRHHTHRIDKLNGGTKHDYRIYSWIYYRIRG